MAHEHEVAAVAANFRIDGETLAITCDRVPDALNRGDRGSVRFGFTMPRMVLGHDMSLCNKIEVHYNNLQLERRKVTAENKSFDEVKDFAVSADKQTVSWIWEVGADATLLAGTLNFCIRFACLTGAELEYEKFSDIYEGIPVGKTIHNTEQVATEHADVLEKWRQEMMAEIRNGLATKITAPSAAVGQTIVVKAVDENGVPTEWEAADLPDSGGNVDYVGVEPAEDDIPKVFLTGDEFDNMTVAKNEVEMAMEYISKTEQFKSPIKIKFQGSSSLSYPKKNFTIKMFTDDTCDTKLKKSFKDWNHSGNKYVLKANFIDHSHARNIVSARLWDEVVSSRPDYDSLPEEMRNSPRNGAVDGFPIKLYVNGTYHGIYTWNIGKDAWMWGMDEDNMNHVLLCGETNTDGEYAETACNFRASWSGTDGEYWSVEVGTNSEKVKTSLNSLIECVMTADNETFRNTIGNYLDVQSAIDYYIFQYVNCGLDGLAKNMLLATYDGAKWICGAYDLDSTWGLYWTGKSFVSAEYACPEDYQEQFSLLWERIGTIFADELKARYFNLRENVLSYSNMVFQFESFMDTIGKELYAEDAEIYADIPSADTNHTKQIRDFVRDRLAYVDSVMIGMGAFTELNYIEANGTQYIDTGVSGGINAAYDLRMNVYGLTQVEWGTYFCGDKTACTPYLQCFSGVSQVWATGGNPVECTGLEHITYNGDVVGKYSSDGCLYGGETNALRKQFNLDGDTGWGEGEWWIFNNPTEPNLGASARLKSLKMYTDGVIVRDFIPVMRNSDNVVGLFDKVNGKFYQNAGTGEFAYG